jgi:hypothetical protein
MKKLFLFILISLIILPAVNAQPERAGGGLAFSSGYHFKNVNYDLNKSGNPALTFKHVHKITMPLEFSPSFVFFYPHVRDIIYEKTSIWTRLFDFDVHYIFNSLEKFEFYGVAGPNLLVTWKRDRYAGAVPTPAPGGQTSGVEVVTHREKDGALGLNLGAGSYMKLTDQFDFYLEAKYIVSKYGQFMLNAGILINIDWLKKHEDTGIN